MQRVQVEASEVVWHMPALLESETESEKRGGAWEIAGGCRARGTVSLGTSGTVSIGTWERAWLGSGFDGWVMQLRLSL